MQHRESDMNKFFSHENHPCLSSLSDQGKLCFGKKSDLLEVLVHDIHSEPPDTVHARLLDGAAVVHLLPTVNVATFDDCADKILLPHISKQLENCTQVDIVWNIYIPNSIKESTREKKERNLKKSGR